MASQVNKEIDRKHQAIMNELKFPEPHPLDIVDDTLQIQSLKTNAESFLLKFFCETCGS